MRAILGAAVIAVLMALPGGNRLEAAGDHARMLPGTTKLLLATADIERLTEQWNATSLGALMARPEMQPYLDELRRADRGAIWNLPQQLGFSWDDLRRMASGEVSLALLPSVSRQWSTIILIDTADREDDVRQWRTAVDQQWSEERGTRTVQPTDGGELIAWSLPTVGRSSPRERLYFISTNLMIAADDAAALSHVLALRREDALGTLAAAPAFKAVLARTVDRQQPQSFFWFAEPVGLWSILRRKDAVQANEIDWLAFWRRQGVEALEGVGGAVYFDAETFDVRHRSLVYAPPPYSKALGMLQFQTGADYRPPAWVTSETSVYTSFYWKMNDVLDAYGHLFDDLFAQGDLGAFAEVLESLATDPDGPKVNIRRDVIANLGPRIILRTDMRGERTADNPHGQRMLLAVAVSNTAKVREAVARYYDGDPGIVTHKREGLTIWSATPGNHLLLGGEGRGPLEEFTCLAIPDRQLMMASHIELLEQALRPPAGGSNGLQGNKDYRQVSQHFPPAKDRRMFLQRFSRLGETLRPTYSMLQENRLADDNGLIALLLGAQVDGGDSLAAWGDGSKLPSIDQYDSVVAPHLGLSGIHVEHVEGGWLIEGFVVRPATASQPQPQP